MLVRPTLRFSAESFHPTVLERVDYLVRSQLPAIPKNLDLFCARTDIDYPGILNRITSTETSPNAGNIFISGAAGSGKSMLLKKLMHDLQAQGIPVIPEDGEPIAMYIPDDILDTLEATLKSTPQKPVAIALDEFITSLDAFGMEPFERLFKLKTQYPNLRILADQDDSMARVALQTDEFESFTPEIKQRFNELFPNPVRLTTCDNPIPSIQKALSASGLAISPDDNGLFQAEFGKCHPSEIIRRFLTAFSDVVQEQATQLAEAAQDITKPLTALPGTVAQVLKKLFPKTDEPDS